MPLVTASHSIDGDYMCVCIYIHTHILWSTSGWL